jgi:hypothetical protein
MRRAFVFGLALSMLAVMAAPAGAGTPVAQASPHVGVVDGQVISVSWHGFRNPPHPNVYLGFVECSRRLPLPPQSFGAPTGQYCAQATEVDQVDVAKGSRQFAVSAGAVGTLGDTCGTSARDRNGCEILVADTSGPGNTAIRSYALAEITFRTP